MATDEKTYMNVKEAALLLRVSESSLYRAVSEGRLPAVQLAEKGSIRILRCDLEPQR